MNQRMSLEWVLCAAFALSPCCWRPRPAVAQVTPAAGFTPPDDTPSIRVGATIFTNYGYQTEPEITDSDGNLVNRSSFDVTRSYINVTGNLSHILAFRITPDIARETSPTSSLNGSLTFRIKYAFLQTNLDDWMTRGSWARFGIQQTPYVDFTREHLPLPLPGHAVRERAGYMSSADAGVSFHYNFPTNYGDVHVGFYNGEGYSRAEANDQKGLQIRATGRPFARQAPVLRGLRGHVFHLQRQLREGRRAASAPSAPSPSSTPSWRRPRVSRRATTSARLLPGMESVRRPGLLAVGRRRARDRVGRPDPLRPPHAQHVVGVRAGGDRRQPHDAARLAAAEPPHRRRRLLVQAAGQRHVVRCCSTTTPSVFKNLTTPETKTVAVHALVTF